MIVRLLNTPCNHTGSLHDTWYLPLGLVHIANFLHINGVEANILDGVFEGYSQTLQVYSDDIVGITFNSFNIREMEAIARKAKATGAFTILGGQAASPLADVLLRNNPDVDAVVVGDGEQAMLALVRALSGNRDLSKVPNLVYRLGQRIVRNPRQETPISELPMPRRDVGGLNPEEYIQAYAASCSDPVQDGVRPTNVVTRRGCPRRAAGKGCSFCARIDRKVRSRTPMQAWEEYRYLAEELDANYLYEDSDSWINIEWLKQLAEIWTRNGGLDVRFRVYGDVRDINQESVELLKRLNVDTVLIGFESGDRNVLIKNGKDFARHDAELACELLAGANIKIADAYVLGLAGESWASIDRTIALANRIHSICETAATYWNIMLPLPGSPSWQMLLNGSPSAKRFVGTYRLDMNEVRQAFFDSCTELGPDALEELEKLRAKLCEISSMPVGEYIR